MGLRGHHLLKRLYHHVRIRHHPNDLLGHPVLLLLLPALRHSGQGQGVREGEERREKDKEGAKGARKADAADVNAADADAADAAT